MRAFVGSIVGVLVGFGAAAWFYGHGGAIFLGGRVIGPGPSSITVTIAPAYAGKPPAGNTNDSRFKVVLPRAE